MAEPFIGQIILVGFNFAPLGYATCDGQRLSIAQNSALFALLGTQFGGDGIVTFALPDLRSRVPVHQGQGSGLPPKTMGEVSGSESIVLTPPQLPAHSHTVNASTAEAAGKDPTNSVLASNPDTAMYAAPPAGAAMRAGMIAPAGGNQPVSILQPYKTINFCIALEGIFPSRN